MIEKLVAPVMEGKIMKTRRTKTDSAGHFAGRLFGMCLVGVVASNAPLSSAQPNDNDRPAFSVSVLDLSDDYQRLVVLLGRSVLIETSIVTSRADVVDVGIVDVQPISPTQLLLTGKGFGTTQVILWSESDRRSMLEVRVELDLRALTEALQAVDPRAHIEVRSVMGSIILTGTVSGAEKAAELTELASVFLPAQSGDGPGPSVQNHMRIAGEQQVRLRCIVAEVSRSAIRQLGINGFLAGDGFQDAFLVNQLGGINPIDIGAAAAVPATGTIPFLTGLDGIPIGSTPSLSLGFPRLQMQLFLKAMSDNSLLTILAEPNLVCISGETATFLAGGEFPVPVPQGNQVVTIEFREFGIRLNFTPVVGANETIRLRVRPEISETDFSTAVQIGGIIVPGLSNRSAETTVEVGSGQTIAIAGLLSEEVKAFASRIPGIGAVPVLGALFRSVEFRRELTELVILVTPEIVAPLDPQQVGKTPGYAQRDPTDFEFYALGLLDSQARREQNAHQKGETAAWTGQDPNDPSIRGPWGFEGSSTEN